MKTNRTREIPRILTLSAVALAALTFASTVNAQSRPAGGDGIAAPPRVIQMLNERRAYIPAAATHAMACPKCANVRTAEVNRQAKGAEILAGAATITVTKHTCTGCETKLNVAGQGKAKHMVATHTCAADVPNPKTCCASN